MSRFVERQIETRRAPVIAWPAGVAAKMVDAQSRHARWLLSQVEFAYVTATVLVSVGFLYASTVPLVFAVPNLEARFRAMFDLYPWHSEELFDLTGNILAFIPIGYLWSAVYGSLPARSDWRLGTFGPAMTVCLGLATLAEGLQFWIPLRDPSVRDILALECGAFIGYGLWRLAGGWTTTLLGNSVDAVYIVVGPRWFKLRWPVLLVIMFSVCLLVNCHASPSQLFLLYRFRSTSLHEVARLLQDARVERMRSPFRVLVPSVMMALLTATACRISEVGLRFLQQRRLLQSGAGALVGVLHPEHTAPHAIHSNR